MRFPDDAPLSQVVSLQESWPRVQAWLDGPLRQAVGGALAAYCTAIRRVLLFSLIRCAALSYQAVGDHAPAPAGGLWGE